MDSLQDAPAKPSWLFTTETARKALEIRYRNQKLVEEKALALKAQALASKDIADAGPDIRRQRILEQIDALDADFRKANAELRVKITASKARLWELLFPKPGSLKPRSDRTSRQPYTIPEPEPIEPAGPAQDSTKPEQG